MKDFVSNGMIWSTNEIPWTSKFLSTTFWQLINMQQQHGSQPIIFMIYRFWCNSSTYITMVRLRFNVWVVGFSTGLHILHHVARLTNPTTHTNGNLGAFLGLQKKWELQQYAQIVHMLLRSWKEQQLNIL